MSPCTPRGTQENFNGMADAFPNEKINILIVGRSGNGKSSILKSIVLKPEFKETNEIQTTEIVLDGVKKNVDILEFSGIIDTEDDILSNTVDPLTLAKRVIENMKFIHIIVFVLKYGVRYTNQEKTAVRQVKNIFGESIFKDRGILAFSYGDNFDLDRDGGTLYFEQWCEQQTGEIKSLFNEVPNRYILFNNKIKKEDKSLHKQRNDFWEKVIGLLKQSDFHPFDLQMFDNEHLTEAEKKKENKKKKHRPNFVKKPMKFLKISYKGKKP